MRLYTAMIAGKYMGNGAYKLVGGAKFENGDTMKVGLSGWEELDTNDSITQIYTGISSMATIFPGTTPMKYSCH